MIDYRQHKKDTASGIKWTLLNQIITQGVTFGLGILLMSLIVPKEFGLLGMVTVFSGFLSVLRDFGLGSSLIQKKNIEKEEIDTIYWTTVGLGILLTLILILLAPIISEYYEEPRLQKISYALASIFVLQSFTGVQLSLAKKKMKFKLIFKANTLSIIISGILALVLAYNDFGVWTLIIQQVSIALLTSFFFLIWSEYKPRWFWNRKVLKPHLDYSLPLIGRGSINYWSRNADNFFIGKFLGAELLGIYTRSYSIMMLPVSRISGVISSVLFPSLSVIQDDTKRIVNIFFKITRTIAFITFPLMMILALGAKDFVETLLGDEWLKMIPIIQILASVGALQSLGTLNGNIFLVKNRTGLAFKVNILNSCVYVIGFYFSSHYDLTRVSLVYLSSNFMLLLINWYIVEKILQIKVFSLLKNVTLHLIGYSTILLIGYLLVIPELNRLQLIGIVNLTIIGLYVISIWGLLFLFLDKSMLKEQVRMLKDVL